MDWAGVDPKPAIDFSIASGGSLTELEMAVATRSAIVRLLKKWRRGLVTEKAVHEQAEAWWEESAPERPYPEGDPRSIADEVLSQLDALNHQWITPDDVPAILAFLDTPPGRELTGWDNWRKYWDGIDWDARGEELRDNPYYSAR